MNISSKLLTLFCLVAFLQPVLSQDIHPQSIIRHEFPGTKNIYYHTEHAMILKFNPEKTLILSLTFLSDPSSGNLIGIKGFDYSAKGFGKCFQSDSLEILLDNGKKLKVGSSVQKICDQPISGWMILSHENQEKLFSSRLRQINYTNKETNETVMLDITLADDKDYFLTIKNLYDKMVPKAPAK